VNAGVFVGFAALGFVLSACATIVDGTNQSIAITTSPASGAQCTLTSADGTYFVTTPARVNVHKTKNDITATCRKNGFRDSLVTIPAQFQYANAGNVLSAGLGIAVDAASGAGYQYPETFDVPLTPMAIPVAAVLNRPGT